MENQEKIPILKAETAPQKGAAFYMEKTLPGIFTVPCHAFSVFSWSQTARRRGGCVFMVAALAAAIKGCPTAYRTRACPLTALRRSAYP